MRLLLRIYQQFLITASETGTFKPNRLTISAKLTTIAFQCRHSIAIPY